MKKIRTLGLLALLALLLVFPLLFPDPAVTIIAIFTLLYAGAATDGSLLRVHGLYLPGQRGVLRYWWVRPGPAV